MGCSSHRDPLAHLGARIGWHLPRPVVSLTMARAEFVLRPFEGLPGEPDWVAMREVVPAATATARTTALHRSDGVVMLALQQHAGSGDASRDLADLLLRVLDLEPGTPIWSAPAPDPGPRLQDVLDLSVPFEGTVHDSFEYWTPEGTELPPEVEASRAELGP